MKASSVVATVFLLFCHMSGTIVRSSGRAILFDGENDHLHLPLYDKESNATLSLSHDAFTIEFWATSFASRETLLRGALDWILFQRNLDGSLVFAFGSRGICDNKHCYPMQSSFTHLLPTGHKVHLAVACERPQGSRLCIVYRDALPVLETQMIEWNLNTAEVPQELHLGCHEIPIPSGWVLDRSSSSCFVGLIDEIRVWKKARSAAEIDAARFLTRQEDVMATAVKGRHMALSLLGHCTFDNYELEDCLHRLPSVQYIPALTHSPFELDEGPVYGMIQTYGATLIGLEKWQRLSLYASRAQPYTARIAVRTSLADKLTFKWRAATGSSDSPAMQSVELVDTGKSLPENSVYLNGALDSTSSVSVLEFTITPSEFYLGPEAPHIEIGIPLSTLPQWIALQFESDAGYDTVGLFEVVQSTIPALGLSDVINFFPYSGYVQLDAMMPSDAPLTFECHIRFSEELTFVPLAEIERGAKSLVVAWRNGAIYIETSEVSDTPRSFVGRSASVLHPSQGFHLAIVWDHHSEEFSILGAGSIMPLLDITGTVPLLGRWLEDGISVQTSSIGASASFPDELPAPFESFALPSSTTPGLPECSCELSPPLCSPLECTEADMLRPECLQASFDCFSDVFGSTTHRQCTECTLSAECAFSGQSCDATTSQCAHAKRVCEIVRSRPGATYSCHCPLNATSCTTGCSHGVCVLEEKRCQSDSFHPSVSSAQCGCLFGGSTCLASTSNEQCDPSSPECALKQLECEINWMEDKDPAFYCGCAVDPESCSLPSCTLLDADTLACQIEVERCRQSAASIDSESATPDASASENSSTTLSPAVSQTPTLASTVTSTMRLTTTIETTATAAISPTTSTLATTQPSTTSPTTSTLATTEPSTTSPTTSTLATTPSMPLCGCYLAAPCCCPNECANNEPSLIECQQGAYDCYTEYFGSSTERDCPECTLMSDCELAGSSCDPARPQCQLKQASCKTVQTIPGAEYECHCVLDQSSCSTGCAQGVCRREEKQCEVDQVSALRGTCECDILSDCSIVPEGCDATSAECHRDQVICVFFRMIYWAPFPPCPCQVQADTCALLDCDSLTADTFQCRVASEMCRQSESTRGVQRRLLSPPEEICPCNIDFAFCIAVDCSIESAASPACMNQSMACLEDRFGNSRFSCPDTCEIDVWTRNMSGAECGVDQCVYLQEVAELVNNYSFADYLCHATLDSVCSAGEYAALAPCYTAQLECEIATMLDVFSSAECPCVLEDDCTIIQDSCAEVESASCVKKQKECNVQHRTSHLAHLPCLCDIDATTCSINETGADCSDFHRVMACQFFLLACKTSLASAARHPFARVLDDRTPSASRDPLTLTIGSEKLARTHFAAETMRQSPVTVTEIRLWSTARSVHELQSTSNSRLRGNEPFLEFYAPIIRADVNTYLLSSRRRGQRLTNLRMTTPEDPGYADATIYCTAQDKCNTLEPGSVGYYVEASKISSLAEYWETRDYRSPEAAQTFEVQMYRDAGRKTADDEVIEIVSLPSGACGAWALETPTGVERIDRLVVPFILERSHKLLFSPVTRTDDVCSASFRYSFKNLALGVIPDLADLVVRVLPPGPQLKAVTAVVAASLPGATENKWKDRTLLLTFDKATSRPPIASTDDLRRFLTFSDMSRWGDLQSVRLHGRWSDDAKLLSVVFDEMSDRNPLTLVAGDVVRVQGGAEWLDSTHWGRPLRTSVGSWVEEALPSHIQPVSDTPFTTLESIRDLTLRKMPNSIGTPASYWADTALILQNDVVSAAFACAGVAVWFKDKGRCATCGPYQRLSENRLECECEEGTESFHAPPDSGAFEDQTCTPCPPGYEGRHGRCYKCEPGTYNQKTQQSVCTVCPINTFRNASMPADEECAPCEANAVSDLASSECITCKEGYQRKAGTSQCEACPQGTYRPSNATSCIPCGPQQTTLLKGASSAGACRCVEGFHDTSNEQNELQCDPCPEGMICRFDGVALLPGFWLPQQPSAFRFNLNDLHRCLPSSSVTINAPAASATCPGALINETRCPPHSQSLLCGICDDDFFKPPLGLCTPCGGVQFVVIAAALVLLCCFAFYFVTEKGGTSLSIFLRFVLTLAALYSASTVEWPSPFSVVVFMLEQLDLDFSFLLRSCLPWLRTTKHLYILQSALPLLVMVAWVGLYISSYIVSASSALWSRRGVTWLHHRLRFDLQRLRQLSCARGSLRPHKRGPRQLAETSRMIDHTAPPPITPMVVDQVLRAALHLWCTFNIALTMRGLAFLECFEHPNGLWSLIENPTVYCDTGQWLTFYLPLGLLMILTNNVCVAGLLTAALLLAPYRWQYSPRFRTRFGFLISPYKKDVWWWGALHFIRGVAMTITSVAFKNDVYLQALVLISIIGVSLALQSRTWPFRSDYENVMEVLLQVGLVFIIMAGLKFAPLQSSHAQLLRFSPMVFVGAIALMLNILPLAEIHLKRRSGAGRGWTAVQQSALHAMSHGVRRVSTSEKARYSLSVETANFTNATPSEIVRAEVDEDNDIFLATNHLRFCKVISSITKLSTTKLLSILESLSEDDLSVVCRCVAICEDFVPTWQNAGQNRVGGSRW